MFSMTQEEIVALLKNPPKLDLEGAKQYCLKEGNHTLGIRSPEDIKYWMEAGSETSGLSMTSKKLHPGEGPKFRRAFYDSVSYNDSAVYDAMKEAGVKAWQKKLKEGDPNKKRGAGFFQFYLSIHLGVSRSRQNSATLFSGSRWSSLAQVWPEDYYSGVKRSFLTSLEDGDKEAEKLASFGYCDVMVVENKAVVFIKLPKETHMENMAVEGADKSAFELSNTFGPAKVSRNGKTEYWYRGHRIKVGYRDSKLGDTDKEIFEKIFRNGKILMTVPKTISDVEDEQLARLLLANFSKEEIKASIELKDVLNASSQRFRTEFLGYFSRDEIRDETTVKAILKNDNSEMRRLLLKNYEPEEIFEACDAKLISEEVDKLPCSCSACAANPSLKPGVNELYSVDIGLDESYRAADPKRGDSAGEGIWGRYENRAKMLRYKCTSTDRVYCKFVPFEMTSANEAQAWGHHMTLTEYLNDLVAQS